MVALSFPKEIPSFGKTATFISLNDLTHYVVFAGIAWLLGYVLFRGWWHNRKIIQEMPSGADMRREAMWSALTGVVEKIHLDLGLRSAHVAICEVECDTPCLLQGLVFRCFLRGGACDRHHDDRDSADSSNHFHTVRSCAILRPVWVVY